MILPREFDAPVPSGDALTTSILSSNRSASPVAVDHFYCLQIFDVG